ncbi:hypothetical protein MMPV_005624 [Pyropia vietnamensis]
MVAVLTARRPAAAASRTCCGRRRCRWRLVCDPTAVVVVVVIAVVVVVSTAAAVAAEGTDAAASSGPVSTLAATLLARPKLALAAGAGCPSSLRLPPAPSDGGEEGGEGVELVASGNRGVCDGGLTLRGAAVAAARLFDTANATAYDGSGGGAWLGTALALTTMSGGGDAAKQVLVGEPRAGSEGGGGSDDDEVDACRTTGVVLVRSQVPLTLSATGGSGTTHVQVLPGVVAAVALLPTADGGASCVYSATDGDGGGDGNDDSACFPADALVWVYPSGSEAADGPPIATTMANLRLGDVVAIGGGRTSRVVAFSHADPAAVTTMVMVTTAGGERLMLSPGHFVYTATGGSVSCCGSDGSANNRTRDAASITEWTLTPAAALTVGSTLRSPTSGPLPVTAVTLSRAVGLYNPHTAAADGDLLVGGVWVSTWTTAVGVGLGRALLAPVRWWAAVAGVRGGLGPDGWLQSGGGGVHRWLPHRMRTW